MKERNYFLKRKPVKTRAVEEVTRITIISSCKLNIKYEPVRFSLPHCSPDLTMRMTRTICVFKLPRPTLVTASPTCPSPAAPRGCWPPSPTPTSPATCLACWAPARSRSVSPALPVRRTPPHQTPAKCIWRSRHISPTVGRSVDVCWSPALIIKTQPKTPEPRVGGILGSPSRSPSPTQQQGKQDKRDNTKTGECFGVVLHSQQPSANISV